MAAIAHPHDRLVLPNDDQLGIVTDTGPHGNHEFVKLYSTVTSVVAVVHILQVTIQYEAAPLLDHQSSVALHQTLSGHA